MSYQYRIIEKWFLDFDRPKSYYALQRKRWFGMWFHTGIFAYSVDNLKSKIQDALENIKSSQEIKSKENNVIEVFELDVKL